MRDDMFLRPYAEACWGFAESVSGWQQSGLRKPATDSVAAREWSIEHLHTDPWAIRALKDGDVLGLSFFDASVSAFCGATGRCDEPNDFLVVMAGLRVSLEAAALAYFLLKPGPDPVERLTRYANLSLEDLWHERQRTKLGSQAVNPRRTVPLADLDDRESEITETIARLTGDQPIRDGKKAPVFGKRTSITERMDDLHRACFPGEHGEDWADSVYGLLSGPAHASLSTIRDLYQPQLHSDDDGLRRQPPDTSVVGSSLLTTAFGIWTASLALEQRFGWEHSGESLAAVGAFITLLSDAREADEQP